MKANVLGIRSKITENIAKYHYDQVNKIEEEMEKKEGKKGRKRIKMS